MNPFQQGPKSFCSIRRLSVSNQRPNPGGPPRPAPGNGGGPPNPGPGGPATKPGGGGKLPAVTMLVGFVKSG